MPGAMPFAGRNAVLATMHGKEAAIAGPMRNILGLDISVPPDLDTDKFGTFTQDINRPGTMDEVLKLKAALGIQLSGLDIGLASEGSYGPHPHAPFIPLGLEKMIFIDQSMGLCCIEQKFDHMPTYRSWHIQSMKELDALHLTLLSIGFPEQALVVRTPPKSAAFLFQKGVQEIELLDRSVHDLLAASRGSGVLLETDMRAHMNPARMRTLSDLASTLAHRLATPCPACGYPGWGRTGFEAGLPCSWCAQPTDVTSVEILSCPFCMNAERRSAHDDMQFADPGLCQNCNP